MRLDYTRLRVRIGEKLEKALEKAAHVERNTPKSTSQARVFITRRTTAKTLVAAGHVNPQILGVIRIIASLGRGEGGVRREIVSKVKILCKKL